MKTPCCPRDCRGNIFILCLYSALAAVCSGQIVINEIHSNPDVKTELVEFIELCNTGSNTINLSGWQLGNAVEYTMPNGTTLAPGGYLVVAQNPAALKAKFGVTALGPWTGVLANEGETIELRNAAGDIENKVDYQLGFPWPTVGDPPGCSMELVNPSFDNNLGGNWRASAKGDQAAQSQTLIATGTTWRYAKGLSEPSSPVTAWRAANFNDSGWLTGTAPIGYDPVVSMGTVLSDMNDNYTTVYFRKFFVVTNLSSIGGMTLEALYDDGFKVWINGVPVLTVNMPDAEVPCTGTAITTRENNSYDLFTLPNPQSFLQAGTNIIAIQGANILKSGSSDFFLDLRLTAQANPAPHGPTPGKINSVFAANLPPQIRQVDHSPKEPCSGQPVTITAKVTDPEGVSSVTLEYQVVTPGNYIELTDPAFTNNWTSVAMNDAGINGDALADDSIYTAIIPAAAQQHRNLVRYRIKASDGTGMSISAPYSDDPQPNFAFFCYDGVPEWKGAVQPGVTPVITFDTNVMRRLQPVQLISKSNSVVNSTWFSRYDGDLYQWQGTLVYDGKVFDHIRYRARGGVHRYDMVKNMWKFDLNRGHDMEMRDNYGKKYDISWTKLNLGACIQQGAFGHRGEQGMFESVGFRLFNLAGVEAPNTSFVQFRVIDDAMESTTNQYEGDFWGLYLAVEQEDGRFLDEHGLPDSNFYKMEDGTGTLNNSGPLGPVDKSDLNYFLNTYNNTTPADSWWLTNLDMARYYSYRTIVEGIHHYDIAYGKNYFYYSDPVSRLWSVHTWDIDLTWADNMFGDGNEPFKSRVLPRAAFTLEYKNRLREIRDLLFNVNQAYQLIDEYASLLKGPTNGPTFLDADRCQWDYNPKMNDGAYSASLGNAGQGRFYQWSEPGVSKDFNGGIQVMKNYIYNRGAFLDGLSIDPLIPAQPSISYIGPSAHPLNQLAFRSSAYSGTAPFAAMKWRVGEVADPTAPGFDPASPRPYEIIAKWESGEITNFNSDITIPIEALKAGHAYCARVRMKDTTGRWSRWSAPVQFVSTQPENSAALVSCLRISELMYNPPAGSDYEFIELHNVSTDQTLDLGGAAFTAGVSFTFPSGTSLAPGAYLVLIRNASPAAFRSYYGLSTNVAIAGPYSGSLANEGEQVTLKTAAGGTEICDFKYGNGRGWPLAASGAGHSLVPVEVEVQGQATGALDYPGNWRASTYINGSPGQADPAPPSPSILLNEIAANTDYTNAAHPDYNSDDWIEIYNATSTNIVLNGWYLSDDPNTPAKWKIPTITVPARGWISFDEVNDFHNPITTGFGLDKAGEQVLLSYLPGTAADRVVDAVGFKGQEKEIALSRYADGAPFWYATARTRNGVNSSPLPGLRFTEIMYHPPDLGTNDNTRDEFIELYNSTENPIALQSTNGTWRLDGGIGYTFPTNTIIPAGGALLIVNFAPSDAATSNAFCAAYGLKSGISLLGPYSGKLGNRSDRVALERPQFPDKPGDSYSWVIVDEVIYGNQRPWPASANGMGCSLNRRSLTQSGCDPANWFAAAPTPGDARADRDGDGMPNDWGVDSINYSADGVVFRFTAFSGRSYSIQFRDSLVTGSWQTLTNIASDTVTRPITISDPSSNEGQSRFYRLVTPAGP